MRPAYPFSPQAGNSITRSVSTSSASVAIPGDPTRVRLLTKPTDSPVWVEFGTSGVTASTSTSMRLNAGAIEVFSVPLNVTHIAAITDSGSATLYITPGEGA
jgi:hypothetical protein